MAALTQSILPENTYTPVIYDSDDDEFSDDEAWLDGLIDQGIVNVNPQEGVSKGRRTRRSAMDMRQVEKLLDTDYLAKVNIENYQTTNPTLMTDILNPDIFNFTVAKNTVDRVVQNIVDRDKKKRKHDDGIWTYCTGDCVGELTKLINK